MIIKKRGLNNFELIAKGTSASAEFLGRDFIVTDCEGPGNFGFESYHRALIDLIPEEQLKRLLESMTDAENVIEIDFQYKSIKTFPKSAVISIIQMALDKFTPEKLSTKFSIYEKDVSIDSDGCYYVPFYPSNSFIDNVNIYEDVFGTIANVEEELEKSDINLRLRLILNPFLENKAK